MYLNTDFSHVKIFFQNILLKTAWLCDVRLQNYGAINFVPFFGPPCSFQLQHAIHTFRLFIYFFSNLSENGNIRLRLLFQPTHDAAGVAAYRPVILGQNVVSSVMWVTGWRSKKLQFFDKQRQISNRKDMHDKSSIFFLNFPKVGDLQSQILYFLQKIIRQADI